MLPGILFGTGALNFGGCFGRSALHLPQTAQIFIVGLAQVPLDHPTLLEARNTFQTHIHRSAHLRPFPRLGVLVLDVATNAQKTIARDYLPSVQVRRRHVNHHRERVVPTQESHLPLQDPAVPLPADLMLGEEVRVDLPDLVILNMQFQHSPKLFPGRGENTLHGEMYHTWEQQRSRDKCSYTTFEDSAVDVGEFWKISSEYLKFHFEFGYF